MAGRKGDGTFDIGNEIGKRFTSENQPANPGRKPMIYTKLKNILKKEFDVQLTKEDYEKIFAYILELTPDEIAKLGKGDISKHIPMYILILINSLSSDLDNGNMNNFTAIMDRVFGKSVEKKEIRADIGTGIRVEDWIKDKIRK